ncbi:MAG: hypothetical protein RL689_349, partial [Planctomycetota bacterium]
MGTLSDLDHRIKRPAAVPMSQTPSQAPTKDPSGPPPGGWPAHPLPRGMRIGRDGAIELQSPVARGGMGEVWAAWLHDPRTPRRIAVK